MLRGGAGRTTARAQTRTRTRVHGTSPLAVHDCKRTVKRLPVQRTPLLPRVTDNWARQHPSTCHHQAICHSEVRTCSGYDTPHSSPPSSRPTPVRHSRAASLFWCAVASSLSARCDATLRTCEHVRRTVCMQAWAIALRRCSPHQPKDPPAPHFEHGTPLRCSIITITPTRRPCNPPLR